MTPIVARSTLAALVVAVACAHAPSSTPSEPQPAAPSVASEVQRGPMRIAIDGDPNGLLWQVDAKALLVADGDHDRILRWTDREGIAVHVQLPTSQGRGLGQIARMPDGTLVVTRFGGGESGGVVTIAPHGRASEVPNLDPKRRRIGLAVAPDGTLFTGWFETHGDARVGVLARLDLAGSETVALQGLQKPVGLAVVGDSLFVADRRLGQVLRAPLAHVDQAEPFVASIAEPDLLCAGPAGSLLTGGKNGEVRRIDAHGEVSVVADGFSSVRGVAFDDAHDRIFVAEHDTGDTDGLAHAIHILPIGDP